MHPAMDPFAGGPAPDRPRLFVDVQHGLCNRLRALVSGAAIAARTGRQLVVIWVPDHHCEARIGDVLRYPGMVIEERDTAWRIQARSARVYNYLEIEPGSRFQEPILTEGDDWPGADVYVRSAYTLNSPHRTDADEQYFLRRLVPSLPVLELVDQVPHPSSVAVHIRMATGQDYDHLSFESPQNWPENRHQELTEWRAKSHVSHFIARLDQLVEAGQADSIFVATDLEQTYALLTERYGARLRFLKRDRFDRSARQIQYAFADLLLLTAAPLFLGSTWSSFSDVAQRLARPGRRFERSGHEF